MLHNQLHTMYTAYALSTMYTLSFTASSLQDTGTHNHNTCLYHSTETQVVREQHMFACSAQTTRPETKHTVHVLWGNDLLPGCKTFLRSSSIPSSHLAISCAQTVHNRAVFKPRDILGTTRLNSNLRLRVQKPET